MSAHHARLSPKALLGFDLPKRRQDGLAPADQRELLKRLKSYAVDWKLLGPHLGFEDAGYFRKRLYRDREWEMLLLCWLPGQTTVIHDHMTSWGATLVLAGEVTESLFRWRGEGRPLERKVARSLGVRKTTVETVTTLHKVENASKMPAVSLHLYSPPLKLLNSYDPVTGRRHAVTLDVSPSVAVGGRPQAGSRRRSK